MTFIDLLLANLLAFYLAYLLAFYLAYLLAYVLAYLLRFFQILQIASANFIVLDLLQLIHNQFFACSLCKQQKAFIAVVWQPVAIIFRLNITTKQ